MKSKTIKCLMTTFTMILLSFAKVFAADESEAMTMKDLFYIIRSVAIPVAAVAIGFGAVKMLVSGEKGAEIAKKSISRVLLSVMALYILPLSIQLGATYGEKYKWDPNQYITGENPYFTQSENSIYESGNTETTKTTDNNHRADSTKSTKATITITLSNGKRVTDTKENINKNYKRVHGEWIKK